MKIVFLTGAGMSVESGLTTFRDAGGLWENYPVMEVASHDGWERNPEKVNAFYNMLRVKYKDVKPCEGGEGFLIPISSPAFRAASRAMTDVYGIEPVPSRGGGSIAVLASMQKILGVDPLLMGFGLERDTIHSPNESFLLSQFFAGMESISKFYEYYD